MVAPAPSRPIRTPLIPAGNPHPFTGRPLNCLTTDRAQAKARLEDHRARWLDLLHGRWLQRDPAEYVDGMNLYEYVKSAPTRYADPFGYWGRDVHYDLTLELAKRAGICCPEAVAAGANRPDTDYRDAPTSVHAAKLLRLTATIDEYGGRILHSRNMRRRAREAREEADRRMREAASWHFPANPDGVVEPDSTAAKARVEQGVRVCNFKLFAEGLHTLQDSWSHQGKPYLKEGLGHARGARPIYSYEYSCDGEACLLVPQEIVGYERLKGWRAAISKSADYVSLWPADVRRAANATYLQMLRFKKNCPWSCPGPNNTRLPTSSRKAQERRDVSTWLVGKYPGSNKVK